MTIYCINICKHLKNIQKALSGKPYLCPSVASHNNNYNKRNAVALQIALVSQLSGEIIFYDIIVDGEHLLRFHTIFCELDAGFVLHYRRGFNGEPGEPLPWSVHRFVLFLFFSFFSFVCVSVCACECL